MQLIRPLSGWPADHKKVTDSSGCVTFSANDPFPAGKVGCGPTPTSAKCCTPYNWPGGRKSTDAETCARGDLKGAGAQASSSTCASWGGVWCPGVSGEFDGNCKSGTCSSTNEECITPPYHSCGSAFNGYQNAGTNFYSYGNSAPQTSYEMDVRS